MGFKFERLEVWQLAVEYSDMIYVFNPGRQSPVTGRYEVKELNHERKIQII